MTEEVQDTNQGDTQDTSAPPVPSVSDASNDEASGQSGVDIGVLVKQVSGLVDDVKALREEMPKEVDRRFKKTSDPRFADVRKVATYLEKHGNDTEAAARAILLDQMIEQYESPQAFSGASGVAPTQDIQAETTELLGSLKDRFGVELSREELGDLAQQTYASTASWLADITDKTMAKVQQSSAVPPAPAPTGGSAASDVSEDDYDGLAGELAKLMAEPINQQNMAKRREIQNKMRKVAGMSAYNQGDSGNR